MSLFINNYAFGFKSVFIPEYGPRHLIKAQSIQGVGRLAHQVVGVVECWPFLGHVVCLIEGLAYICFSTLYRSFHKPKLGANIVSSHTTNPIDLENYHSFESSNEMEDPVIDKIAKYISRQMAHGLACLKNNFIKSKISPSPQKEQLKEAALNEETTRSELGKLWYVPFLGFCLQQQPKNLRDSLQEQNAEAYPILQFVWIQWAIVEYQSKKSDLSQSQEVAALYAKVNGWISGLEASQEPNTIKKPANFKPFIFNEDQIKKTHE